MATPFAPPDQEALATAVHRTVCAYTGSDGVGHCQLYAVTGMLLLRTVTGKQWHVQAGSTWILCDPPDGWWRFDATDPDSRSRGEVHCWIAQGGHGRRPTTVVDLTARHYRRMHETLGRVGVLAGVGEAVPWTREEPPAFLWVTAPLSWVKWQVDERACRHLWNDMTRARDVYGRLFRQAYQHYQQQATACRRATPRKPRRPDNR
jgi:hypothetical protein